MTISATSIVGMIIALLLGIALGWFAHGSRQPHNTLRLPVGASDTEPAPNGSVPDGSVPAGPEPAALTPALESLAVVERLSLIHI